MFEYVLFKTSISNLFITRNPGFSLFEFLDKKSA